MIPTASPAGPRRPRRWRGAVVVSGLACWRGAILAPFRRLAIAELDREPSRPIATRCLLRRATLATPRSRGSRDAGRRRAGRSGTADAARGARAAGRGRRFCSTIWWRRAFWTSPAARPRKLVGKTGHAPSCKQEDISGLMVTLAQGRQACGAAQGRRSDDLRPRHRGDRRLPRRRHSKSRVVPGITAALASAAALGVSLTRRDPARRVQFITAHSKDGVFPEDFDWGALADKRATTAVYMGNRTLPELSKRLIAEGADPATPAFLIRARQHAGAKDYRGHDRRSARQGRARKAGRARAAADRRGAGGVGLRRGGCQCVRRAIESSRYGGSYPAGDLKAKIPRKRIRLVRVLEPCVQPKRANGSARRDRRPRRR